MMDADVKNQMDGLAIPEPDSGFEARLLAHVTAQPRELQAANDNRWDFLTSKKFHLYCCGGMMAAALAVAVSFNLIVLSESDPMVMGVHMLADVEYMEEEQMFAGLAQ